MKQKNKISLKDIRYLIFLFISPFIILIILSLLFGCKQINEPEFNISGRYDNQNDMILILHEQNRLVIADLEWSGYTTRLEGSFDYKNMQVFLGGNYFGYQNITFSLFYKDGILAGGYNYNGQGTQAVKFIFRNKLEKSLFHDQGELQ